jgi:transcriptional regulator with XRE-family HTH domain
MAASLCAFYPEILADFAHSPGSPQPLPRQSDKFQRFFRNFTEEKWKTRDRSDEGPEKTLMVKAVTHAQWFLAPYCIGMKLRSLRTEKRLTLARLSAETGLSTALLSKLETDRMMPTLATLATISRVYGVGLGHFFSEASDHSLSITRKVQSQGRGRSTESGNRIPLNPGVANRRMDACLVDLSPGASEAEPEVSDDGALLVYVLDGKLFLDVGGMRETLEAGDCAYLESDLPLAWGAAGKNRCRVLTVTPSRPHQQSASA